MQGLDKTKIPTALPSKSHLDLTCDHVTTMNFGEFQPVHYRHSIKGETLNLQGAGTIRPFPLACPTFGRIRCNIHHFFVPFRIIFPQYESFYNENIGVNFQTSDIPESAPSILNSDLVNIFISNYSEQIQNWTLGAPYDFYDGSKHYRFTSEGKFFFKILTGLGYAINFNIQDATPYSALPLLAYCKIFLDYYANQAYLNSIDIINIRKILAYNNPNIPLVVSANYIGSIFNLIRHCQYQQDYFVGSWDNPFAPSTGQYSAITFNDIVSGISITRSNNGTPYMRQSTTSTMAVGSQYAHQALHAITDYSKRHQLAGASNINRTLAQYGFGVDALKLDRAVHIGGSSIDVNTGAVFSTANTAPQGAPSSLGDYAGNGFGNGVSGFNYHVDELGIQISIASILPSGGYFQGMDENNMHISRFDFYTPEFDSLSTQIIRKREVYVSRDAPFAQTYTSYDTAFGHTSRYAEYKRPRSWVSGDFRCPTRFLGGNAWHLMREFDDNTFSGDVDNIVHSLDFTRYVDSDSYRRIFINTKTDNDPFYAEFHWSVGSYAPCHGLFDNYEFDTESGKSVTLESNGAIVN